MSSRRFTRLTNEFSKKLESHAQSFALHYMHYNFGAFTKRYALPKRWPLRDRSYLDIVAIIEAAEAVPAKRGPYKKRAAF
jgi:hypothetical protein